MNGTCPPDEYAANLGSSRRSPAATASTMKPACNPERFNYIDDTVGENLRCVPPSSREDDTRQPASRENPHAFEGSSAAAL